MFEDEKIDFIESLPEADAILIIWIKLLTLAGKCNANGYICLTDTIQYDENMLAHKFKRPVNTVKLALQTFERLGMIERTEQGFYISNWEKHQNIEGMDKIREQTKLRNQKYREKKKQILLNDVKCDVTHDVSKTSNDETELDIDKDINNINIINNILSSKSDETVDKPVDKSVDKSKKCSKIENTELNNQIIDYLNEKCNTNYKLSSTKTKNCITARINEGYSLDDFKKVINIKAAEWLENFEMAKYLRPETLFGNKFESYLNQKPVKPQSSKQQKPANKFHNFDQKIAGLGESKLEEMVRKRWS